MSKGPFVEIDINDLNFCERLGSGSSGTVYKGTWISEDKVVAIKKLLILEKEAKVLSSLSHRNIVQFFGAVTKSPNYCIVTEYAELGSVFDYLQKHSIEYTQLLQWAKQIATGMHYLHYEAPQPVIHRDLKSSNVVITADMTVKICDFGSSKFHQHTTKLSMAGTFSWMAPEVIQQLQVTITCDVFSYSVVLWELLTQEIPFKGLEGLQVAWLVVARGERLTIPSSCPAPFGKLMQSCWATEPEERLTFKQILESLDHLLYDGSLKDDTDSFLKRKGEWKEEIDGRLVELRKIEKSLTHKEKELAVRERIVKAREKELEQQISKNALSHKEHNVATWSEEEVVDWLHRLNMPSSTTSFACYSDLFVQNHITGNCLLDLTNDDLLQIGVHSVGHRREMMKEIEVLRQDNHRLLHFPPLSAPKLSPGQQQDDPALLQTEPLTVVMVNLCRRKTELEYKWKFLVDLEGSPLAVSCVKEVLLVLPSGETITLSKQPFLMDSWREDPHAGPLEIILRYRSKVRLPQLTKFRFRTKKDSSLEELPVSLELKPTKSITMETPTNQDECDNILDQWDIVSPMQAGQMVASGVWAVRADYPGTPLEARDEGGGAGTPRRFSVVESPPIEMGYRGPPLQGAWTKPLGLMGLREHCPRGSGRSTCVTPPTAVSPTLIMKAAEPSVMARRGVASPQGTLYGFNRQSSHPNMEVAKVGSAQYAQNRRHSSMLRAVGGNYGNYGARRISQPPGIRGNEYQRSESDSKAMDGPPGDQRKNTSEPIPPSRTQSCSGGGAAGKPHRVKR